MGYSVFDSIPDLTDLLPNGGRPGFEYAIIASQNILRAQREGWDTIERLSAFEVKGPLGSCPALLMGKGDAVYGAAPTACRSKSWLDPDISDATGLWLPGDEPQPVTATATGTTAATAAGAKTGPPQTKSSSA